MSLLFLEGQARVGKTTTAQELRKLFFSQGRNAVVQKFSMSPISRHHVLIGQILPLAVDDDTIHIIDRGITTELVYASLYQRPIDLKIFSYLDSLMSRLLCVNMLLTADRETLVKRHEATNRTYEGDIDAISNLFYRYWDMSDITGFRYDTTFTDSQDVAHQIMSDFFLVEQQKKGEVLR